MSIGSAVRSVEVRFFGNTSALEGSLAKMGVETDAASDAMSDSFGHAGKKVGNTFDKLGEKMENLGLPFGSTFTKMGAKIDEADTKGKKLGATMAEWGKVGLVSVGAGGLAVLGESLHLADQFEPVLAALQTSIKNSGGSWKEYSARIQDADTAMSHYGFNMTDTDSALQSLTTATKSPTKALSDLSEVANIAAMNHESLTAAAGQYDKLLAGSMRILKTWGINLNIGSGALHSVQSATMALTNAQENLKKVQEQVKTSTASSTGSTSTLAAAQLRLAGVQKEIKNGAISSKEAQTDLAAAQFSVAQATRTANESATASHLQLLAAETAVQQKEKELKQSHDAIADALKVVAERSKGAAAAYGKTFAGEIHSAGAELENFGTVLGEDLIPWIDKLIGDGTKVLGFFEHNKAAAIALAAVIGGPLAITIGAFIVSKVDSLINKAGMLGERLLGIGKSAEETADPVSELTAMLTKQNETLSSLSESLSSTSVGFSDLVDPTAEINSSMELMNENAEVLARTFAVLGEEAPAAGEAIGVSMEAAAATTEEASAEMEESIGSTGVGAIVIGLSMAAMLLLTHWKFVWGHVKTVALDAWHFLDRDVLHPIEGAFKLAWGLIKKYYVDPYVDAWHLIKTVALDAWHFLSNDVLHPIGEAFMAEWHFIDSFFVKPLMTAFHLVERAVGDVTHLIGGISHTAGHILSDVNPLHWLAKGGIVTKPTIVGVGENGPEAVIPLDRLPSGMDFMGRGISALSSSSLGHSGSASGANAPAGGVTNHWTLNAITNASSRDIAREIEFAQREHGV